MNKYEAFPTDISVNYIVIGAEPKFTPVTWGVYRRNDEDEFGVGDKPVASFSGDNAENDALHYAKIMCARYEFIQDSQPETPPTLCVHCGSNLDSHAPNCPTRKQTRKCNNCNMIHLGDLVPPVQCPRCHSCDIYVWTGDPMTGNYESIRKPNPEIDRKSSSCSSCGTPDGAPHQRGCLAVESRLKENEAREEATYAEDSHDNPTSSVSVVPDFDVDDTSGPDSEDEADD